MSSIESSSQRRRGAALEKALLDAAWAELKSVGYNRLTFDNVARLSGTSKPVLYRRWANRLELVRAALRAHRPSLSGATPDTGTLRGDIIALLEYRNSALRGLRRDITWGMLSDAIGDNKQLDLFRDEITRSNIASMKTILQRAGVRGEVNAEVIPDRIITLPIDLTRHEMLVSGRPASKAVIRQIVDDIYLPLLSLKR